MGTIIMFPFTQKLQSEYKLLSVLASSKGRGVYHARGKTHTNWRGGGMFSLPLDATLLATAILFLFLVWGDNALIQCTLLLLAAGGEACKVRYRTK